MPRTHRLRVSKKPQKVADPASPYAAKKPAKAAAPTPKKGDAEFQRITGKLFKERKELLQKLAQ